MLNATKLLLNLGMALLKMVSFKFAALGTEFIMKTRKSSLQLQRQSGSNLMTDIKVLKTLSTHLKFSLMLVT